MEFDEFLRNQQILLANIQTSLNNLEMNVKRIMINIDSLLEKKVNDNV